jgi:hypothetical protein
MASVCILHAAQGQTQHIQAPAELMGHRFLTLNTVIRVNQFMSIYLIFMFEAGLSWEKDYTFVPEFKICMS